MTRCAKCVLPAAEGPDETFAVGNTLDERGICRYCRSYRPVVYQGEEALLQILDESRGKGRYDCIVNISGGRGSAYTLLSLVKDYKLRVLAVNYANPFTDPQAKKNIENMVRILGIDFHPFRLRRRIHERVLRNNFAALLKRPSPAMVPAICIGCKIIWPTILKIARSHGIRCIVNGGNPYEYTSFKKALLGIPVDADLKRTYWANFRGLARETFQNPAFVRPSLLPVTLKGYLFSNPNAIGSRLMGRGIRFVDYFHFVPWERNRVLNRIRSELDWDSPQNWHSDWRFDCQIAHLKDYLYLKMLGVTEKDDFYAKLVREGQITREDALARLDQENRVPVEILPSLFASLGLEWKDPWSGS